MLEKSKYTLHGNETLIFIFHIICKNNYFLLKTNDSGNIFFHKNFVVKDKIKSKTNKNN